MPLVITDKPDDPKEREEKREGHERSAPTGNTLLVGPCRGITAGFATTMLRGVFAGWLIALMVWLLLYAETGRFCVMHVIAGSVDTLYLVATGQLSIAGFATRVFIPAVLGNIVGGVSLVAALAHASLSSTNRGSGYALHYIVG